MRILVIGHFCLDVIQPNDGPVTRSYGGIYYALATLSGLLTRDDIVLPVFGVNTLDHGPLLEHLDGFGNIDPSGIFKFGEPTNTVELYYQKDAERKERSTNIAKPVSFNQIRRHLGVDGVLINMISGFDIELETLDSIRLGVRERETPIHLDFHSLTLGVDRSDGRFRRPVEEWRRWAFMMETVQMNEEEIGGLTVDRMSEHQTAGHLLTLGTRSVIVTKGSSGSTVYSNQKKQVHRTDIPPARTGPVLDTTGCGDIFGAAFFVNYLKTRDAVASASFAGSVAASRLGTVGSKDMKRQIEEVKAGHGLNRKQEEPETRI